MSQQEINYAFAIGAFQKMAEYDGSPAKFVEAAAQSNHQGMRKIASAVVELDQAVQQEKQAGVWDSVKRALGMEEDYTAGDAVSRGLRDPASMIPIYGGVRDMIEHGAGAGLASSIVGGGLGTAAGGLGGAAPGALLAALSKTNGGRALGTGLALGGSAAGALLGNTAGRGYVLSKLDGVDKSEL